MSFPRSPANTLSFSKVDVALTSDDPRMKMIFVVARDAENVANQAFPSRYFPRNRIALRTPLSVHPHAPLSAIRNFSPLWQNGSCITAL